MKFGDATMIFILILVTWLVVQPSLSSTGWIRIIIVIWIELRIGLELVAFNLVGVSTNSSDRLRKRWC